jgi:16S rRNA (cytosine967-C5)-methyltransferase
MTADRSNRRPTSERAGAAPRSARTVAFRCLQRIDHEGAYANLVTAAELERSGLSERDRKFVTELVQGTTRMRRACDALVDRFVSTTPSPEVRTVLRLGAYQLHFLGVPAHAAVGETVELAPKKARGFVNAVLRRVSTTAMTWPSDAVRLSYPDWIMDRLVAELGADEALAALEAMNEAPSATERDDGYVQDLGSQWVAGAVMAVAGQRVLDVCAAPGGKATALAGREVVVVAADLQPHRVGLIAANARHLDADSVLPLVADGTRPPFAPATFDHVLVDAPCSGLGTLRRRADARWRIRLSDVAELALLQQRMIDACAPLVRPGGTLVYSVCTLLAEESSAHTVPDGFEPIGDEPRGVWHRFGDGWRVLPHDAGTDGMILLRYRRTA